MYFSRLLLSCCLLFGCFSFSFFVVDVFFFFPLAAATATAVLLLFFNWPRFGSRSRSPPLYYFHHF